jgi:hypothetical protein
MRALRHTVAHAGTIQAGAACEPFAGASASSDASASCYGFTENIRILPVIVAELKLSKVERQILLADMMIGANDATLKQRPKVFNVVGMDLSAHILALTMANSLVRISWLEPAITGMFVRSYQVNSIADSFANEVIQSSGIGILNYLADHISLPTNSSDDSDFPATLTTSDMCFLIPVAIFVFAADKRFVYFDDTHKLAEIRIMHRSAEPMAHIPSSGVGRSDLPHDLIRAHAFLGIEYLPENLEPCSERIVRVLKYSPYQNRETIWLAMIRSAHLTSVMPRFESEDIHPLVAASRALNLAIWPAALKQIPLTIVLGREGAHQFAERHHV